jgi:molybdate/tungstate transport system ATP-binding protein
MIHVEDLHVHAGHFWLSGISFAIPQGGYGVLMGRTGCGKTTLLEAICGLKKTERGRIILGGQDVTHLKPADRNIGFVPQDSALFSTMTVYDHLAFALRVRFWARKETDQRVIELAELLGIAHLMQRKPSGLSGGEKQRVALGRALAAKPSTLCLDEPLSALDSETKQQMRQLLKSVQQHTGVTILHITHSRNEAADLADCLLRFVDGSVQAVESQVAAI